MTCTDFQVSRSDFSNTRYQQRDVAELDPGQTLLKVSRFAFTANNITYAAMGDAMRYWEFFPAPEDMGIIPVWGYADNAFFEAKTLYLTGASSKTTLGIPYLLAEVVILEVLVSLV